MSLLPHTDAISFDTPIAMLRACHDKVRRFATLAVSLATHLQTHAPDKNAGASAQQVLRYFDLAAPLHHADEDEDLYPALRALNDLALNQAIDEIQAEHTVLTDLYLSIRPWLLCISQQQISPAPTTVAAFSALYHTHAAREESAIYPAAQGLPLPQLHDIGRRMQQRRGAL